MDQQKLISYNKITIFQHNYNYKLIKLKKCYGSHIRVIMAVIDTNCQW